MYEGMTGKVILDEYADREPDYWITDMAPNGTFVKVAEIVNIDLKTRVSSSNLKTLSKITKQIIRSNNSAQASAEMDLALAPSEYE